MYVALFVQGFVSFIIITSSFKFWRLAKTWFALGFAVAQRSVLAYRLDISMVGWPSLRIRRGAYTPIRDLMHGVWWLVDDALTTFTIIVGLSGGLLSDAYSCM